MVNHEVILMLCSPSGNSTATKRSYALLDFFFPLAMLQWWWSILFRSKKRTKAASRAINRSNDRSLVSHTLTTDDPAVALPIPRAIVSTETPSPASQRRRQCAAAVAAAGAACLAPLVVFLAVLVLAPSLIPRLLLRPRHAVVPYVASGELRALRFDAAASAVTYNLSAVLRFDGPPSLLHARRYTGVRAAPFYAGQELGAAVALPGFTQRGGSGGGDDVLLPVAWAGVQRVPPGRRARAVAAALARERAEGWVSVKVAVRAAQDGKESDFACVMSFPVHHRRDGGGHGNGTAAGVFDGGSCIDAVRSEF